MWAPPMQSLTHLGQNPKWLGLPAWEFFANPLVCSPFNGAGRCNGAVELNAAESIGIGFISDKIPISPSSKKVAVKEAILLQRLGAQNKNSKIRKLSPNKLGEFSTSKHLKVCSGPCVGWLDRLKKRRRKRENKYIWIGQFLEKECAHQSWEWVGSCSSVSMSERMSVIMNVSVPAKYSS